MADNLVPGYKKFWMGKRTSLSADYQLIVTKHPDAEVQLKRLFKIICDIEDVAGYTATSVGESVEWTSIFNTAEDNRTSYCKALTGKTIFSGLYGTYTVTLN
jgi:hypothetical protein